MVWKRLLQYPAQATFLALVMVCLGGIAVLSGVAWRSLGELREMASQERSTARLQAANEQLQRLAIEAIASGHPADAAAVEEIRTELSNLQRGRRHLHPATDAHLADIRARLATPDRFTGEKLQGMARTLEVALGDELAAEHDFVRTLRSDALAELETALLVFLALATLGLAGGWIMHRRIIRPLRDLQAMFVELSRQDFKPIPVSGVHPVLVPLFENYNRLVRRLEELEGEHRSRAAHLELEVRAATKAVLDQQQSLARAERLAAVGEMGASLAHEIRNPLAGVHVALTNIRTDLNDAGLIARLDLTLAELERLTRLVNHQLSPAVHLPEPARPVDLPALVRELLALLRYQVPKHIDLTAEIDQDLRSVLPKDRLRQVLLNLILNSVQALGEKPGRVVVHARSDAGRVRIAVSDDGPGFPPDLLAEGPRSFVSYRAGGTGLGLAMVKRLARDLGGELTLENCEAGGASAILTLPYIHA